MIDYEKAYKEALERAKAYHRNELAGSRKEMMEYIFPELRESEDERIRKFLVDYFASYKIGNVTTKLNGVRIDDILAYLEKQKEPHYTKRNALFDKCVENCDPEIMKRVSDEVDEMLEKEQKPNYCHYGGDPSVERCKYCSAACSARLMEEQKSAEWSKNDTVFLNEITDFFENKTARLQHDLDMYAHWLKSLPERFNLQTKPAEWSEEDKKKINFLARLIEFQVKDDEYCFSDGRFISKQEAIEMLKSLHNRVGKEFLQPHWKPSEEQMHGLAHAINIDVYDAQRYKLDTLYNDLKKLM